MTESTINFQYIQNYSKQFANIVCNRFFQGKNHISGREILEVTGLRQINLLIIMDLYDAWQDEIENVKGPYFDYDAAPVKEAMNDLKNALSNNIRISRETFGPMLEEATRKALVLIFSPYEFFLSMINERPGEKLSTDRLRQAKKYIKVNTHLFNAFLRELEEKKITSGTHAEYTGIFDDVCSHFNDSPDDADQLTGVLAGILPLDLQLIYSEKTEKPSGSAATSLAEAIQTEKKTLLDEFQEDKTDTLADFLKRKSVDSIRKSITINQKFMFVRELFSQDETLFTRSIDELDELRSFQAAEEYIENNFFRSNRWERDNEAVIEFMEVLQKKFS